MPDINITCRPQEKFHSRLSKLKTFRSSCRLFPICISDASLGVPVKVTLHRSLNTCKGVIRPRDVASCSVEEIVKELGPQGVTDALSHKHDGRKYQAKYQAFLHKLISVTTLTSLFQVTMLWLIGPSNMTLTKTVKLMQLNMVCLIQVRKLPSLPNVDLDCDGHLSPRLDHMWSVTVTNQTLMCDNRRWSDQELVMIWMLH